MKHFLFIFLFSLPLASQQAFAKEKMTHSGFFLGSAKKSILIASNGGKNEDKQDEISAYDPFADYSEFENTAEEQENITFFQEGRFLTLGVNGGVKIFTLNMANLFEIGPSYGGYLNYFFDLTFALQFAITGSNHNIAVNLEGTNPFIGSASFLSMGVDFKYFVNRNLFHKQLNWLQPYFLLGVSHSTLTVVATLTNQGGHYEDSGFGINMGLGFELMFLRKIHFGLQYVFKYVTLEEESQGIVLVTSSGQNRTNFKPYGDWMTVTALMGVNF